VILVSQHACLTLGIDSDQETHLQAHLAGEQSLSSHQYNSLDTNVAQLGGHNTLIQCPSETGSVTHYLFNFHDSLALQGWWLQKLVKLLSL
jgi:hypothetical protein